MASYSDEVIDAVAELGVAASGKSFVDSWAMGGATARVGADATAHGDRSAPFLLVFNTAWEDAGDDEGNVRWTRESWESMKRYSSGSLYLNFPGEYEEGDQLMKEAFGANYGRLVDVKNQYDPTKSVSAQPEHQANSLRPGPNSITPRQSPERGESV